jgi:hypothetical protein
MNTENTSYSPEKALVDLAGKKEKKNTSYALDQVTNYTLEKAPVD